jgi:serine/threonine-protein kinase
VPLPTETAVPPTATDEPLPTATDEPLPTATDEALPSATPTTEAVTYEPYSYPTNLFSIDVPQDWSSEDESETGLARVDFQAPQDAYGLSVRVSEAPAGDANLEQVMREFVQNEFGDNTDFTIEDQAETRPNGQVSLGFSYRATPFIGISFVVPGRVVGQINDDKLSLLVVLYEGGEDEQTPERIDVINTMLDSYTVDPTVALP